MIGAEAIVKSLEKEGVEYIFGYPGATIAPLYNELAKSSIRHVLVRHEQHAGHAASGYARISGKPGVCAVTSGPGATNLITALGTAYMDSIPIVAISGQVDSGLLGRDAFQEADMTGATASFTKYSYLVKNALDLPNVVKEAFHIASTGRPGPVLIDVPVDVQLRKSDFKFTDAVNIRGYKPTVKGHAGQVKRAVRSLIRAKRPIVCAGGGVFASGAGDIFLKFVETLNLPVVTTMMGLGVLPTSHRLNMGMVGMHGKSVANRAVKNADLLLLLGARVSDRAVLSPTNLAETAEIIHVDIDPAEIGKNLDTVIPIVGDLKAVLNQIMVHNPESSTKEWLELLYEQKATVKPDYADRSSGINPKAFIHQLTKKLPEDYIYVADVGQNQLWSAGHCDIRKSCRFLTTGGMGTMGYAISAALGAKMRAPERFTVAVCGDGSFQMSMMELGTICQHNVDIKIVVMSNGRLGLVREIQSKQYADHQIAVDLFGSPDPVKIAAAYGLPGRTVNVASEIAPAIEELLTSVGPFILNCRIDPLEASV
ncbi:MAG: biosynthetic-type acetolactate synthase large subunit [Clostridiales Family XIII bacterium]|jgi:acetolactate synthase-1/2/3 large subunit|nr:biosynthetic-type acetolactate synthase large subunit [Clostridiales Family XIII bacterium]